MKKNDYKKIKKYIKIYNQSIHTFLNELRERRLKEKHNFDNSFKNISSNIKNIRRTDGII